MAMETFDAKLLHMMDVRHDDWRVFSIQTKEGIVTHAIGDGRDTVVQRTDCGNTHSRPRL